MDASCLAPFELMSSLDSLISSLALFLRWEQRLLRADLQQVWFEHKINLNPRNVNEALLVSRDITDRRERERPYSHLFFSHLSVHTSCSHLGAPQCRSGWSVSETPSACATSSWRRSAS